MYQPYECTWIGRNEGLFGDCLIKVSVRSSFFFLVIDHSYPPKPPAQKDTCRPLSC